jgi:1-acyl-sn-glycerol-3-phosphate acyltransferase
LVRARTRSEFIEGIASLFSEWGAGGLEVVQPAFDRALEHVSDVEIDELFQRLGTTGGDWGYHPPNDVARIISRTGHSLIAAEGSSFVDDGGVIAAQQGPVIFLGNHLSFVDANTVEFMLAANAADDVARSLTVLAGPKVYSEPIRRVASLCFGTIKTPQSTSRASGEAVMSRRETLRLAALTLEHTRERREHGEHLLIFAEGTRSRKAAMQRVLAAIARYVEQPFATVVPFAVWGTESLVPIDDERAHPGAVHVRMGAPVDSRVLFEHSERKRVVIADAIGFLIADLLPEPYRGHYGSVSDNLEEARRLADESS